MKRRTRGRVIFNCMTLVSLVLALLLWVATVVSAKRSDFSGPGWMIGNVHLNLTSDAILVFNGEQPFLNGTLYVSGGPWPPVVPVAVDVQRYVPFFFQYRRIDAMWTLAIYPLVPALLCTIMPLVWMYRRSDEWWLVRKRRRLGLCTNCGYDLQGSPGSACPECGENATAAAHDGSAPTA